MIRSCLTALAAVLAFSPAVALAQEPPVEAQTVYRNVTLIDGTGAPARAAMNILVRGERIERVWKEGEIAFKLSPDTRVVDMTGRFVLPGLTDSHQHLATPPNRRFAGPSS